MFLLYGTFRAVDMRVEQVNASAQLAYEQELLDWRQRMETNLRRDDSWLTLAGLCWLHVGENTVGSDPTCDIDLPAGSAPERVGVIDFHNGKAALRITCDEPVMIDGTSSREALLRDDNNERGATLVTIRGITFYVIRRGEQYGVRVRDVNSPVRQAFTGRTWFPIDPQYRIATPLMRYPEARTVLVMDVVGIVEPMDNPGYVTFELHGQALRLEAFNAGADELWFIFKDATSGEATYGVGRFLKVPVNAEGIVDLDFNRAYNPPCAFTKYATCPMPPKENILPVRIEAGERI
ncbi:MAG: DUF1684 domain-containing protein [Anaerolineae bacterium]|nr:DUF1684 domain-containing protein [Anaerolineae bacterium]